jgi:probable rRNA maturation factor
MNVQVDVQQAADDESIPDTAFVSDWVTRAVNAATITRDSEVSVRIVGADEIHALNHEYRQKDAPTNVLSFPAGAVAGLPNDAPQPLGDIVICASVVRDEAEAQGKTLADHWAHMLVHGTLHLLGFDHQTDVEAAAMETLERRILSTHGIADPYGVTVENC